MTKQDLDIQPLLEMISGRTYQSKHDALERVKTMKRDWKLD